MPYGSKGAVVYGTGPFTDPLGFNDQIWAQADRLGFRIDVITGEYDVPQFEYTLTFDDAVKAVDDIALFRQMAREIAYQAGVILTFMPKPLPETSGSGLHINSSFADADGKNALTSAAGAGPDYLNALGAACVAGPIHHHKGLAGLIAPSGTSYKRLQPASLSGYWQNWGGDHRNVTTRVSAEAGAKARLEHRTADACANTHTATAAVLEAAFLGVKNGYSLPPREKGDGIEVTDAKEGTAADLAGAVADLEADTALCEAVGADLCANHNFMKQQEAEKTNTLDDAGLRAFYAYFV